MLVVIVDFHGEWTENVLRDAFFSVLGMNHKCLTRHKRVQHWFPAVFQNSYLLQSGVIVYTKVSDRQRWCGMPCWNIIGCKSSFTCHMLFVFCLLSCWVQSKVRSLCVWWWLCAIWHLQLGTALNLHFKCFSPKQFLASLKLCRDFPPNRRGCCHIWWSSDQYNNSETPTASSAPCGGYCLSAPK